MPAGAWSSPSCCGIERETRLCAAGARMGRPVATEQRPEPRPETPEAASCPGRLVVARCGYGGRRPGTSRSGEEVRDGGGAGPEPGEVAALHLELLEEIVPQLGVERVV